VFDLYIYHILVLVIVKHNGDEPPKNIYPVFVFISSPQVQTVCGNHTSFCYAAICCFFRGRQRAAMSCRG